MSYLLSVESLTASPTTDPSSYKQVAALCVPAYIVSEIKDRNARKKKED